MTTAAETRELVRACLVLAASEQPLHLRPTAQYISRAVALIAPRLDPAEPADPATRAARDLAAAMRAFRDLCDDPSYASLLPAFETLGAALPDPLELPPALTFPPDPEVVR